MEKSVFFTLKRVNHMGYFLSVFLTFIPQNPLFIGFHKS